MTGHQLAGDFHARLGRIRDAADATQLERLQHDAARRFTRGDLGPRTTTADAIAWEQARREWLACELRKHELVAEETPR